MKAQVPKYHENFLHWIWRHIEFSQKGLKTVCGLPIQILQPGQYNTTDGPDFRNARMHIGGLQWFGDVEIHHRQSGWKDHNHHKDPNFNKVVLHVFFEEPDRHSAVRTDGTAPYALYLSPWLKEPVRNLLKEWNKDTDLPCAGAFTFISERAFLDQLNKTHKQYFDAKVDRLLHFYESHLPLSIAWKQMLLKGLFDGLGIRHNREAMQKLADDLIKEIQPPYDEDDIVGKACRLSGLFDANRKQRYRWNHKGVRPANHPQLRVKQAAQLTTCLLKMQLNVLYKTDPKNSWQTLMNSVTTETGIGRERSSILYATVYLPALYNLGVILEHKQLKSQSYERWINHHAQIPESILQPFDILNISSKKYLKKLGAVFQLKHYCRKHRCCECEVFKSAINA